MDGHKRTSALVIVRVSFLLACAAMLVFVSGDLRARLTAADRGGASGSVPFAAEMHIAEGNARGVWKARELAIFRGDRQALRRLTDEPLTSQDMASSRWGRRAHDHRPLPSYTRVLMSAKTTREMVVAFSTSTLSTPLRYAPGSNAAVLATYVRPDGDRPSSQWRLVLEVPLLSWPWTSGLWPQNRHADLPAEAILRSHMKGRSVTRVVQIPLIRDRTLVCGAVRAEPRRRLPGNQVCVVANDAKPNRPHYVGSTQPLFHGTPPL